MSGIIINDAIVLVSTIQDHARRQSIAASAVAGARDRLRPILLTTLTTVLGLAPLMYESSRQALFLKPTVVTLVYGLSVGFFAVLLLVPALLMIQSDLSRGVGTLRKVLVGRRFNHRFRSAVAGIVVAVLALNTAILGPWVVTGNAVVPLELWGAKWVTFSAGAASLVWAVTLTLLLIALFAATSGILIQRSRQ
ncbi:AcrB/AcrD/AcrF family protein [Antarctobacter heliothermus]|uniref:AcrB/AcrD/AcrF family protein n=2 Tax=Antarctobacter heliothermus TaxID=74033 RepID=A0A239LEW7_9RHOB|nr:AcrB/AcrD/AcrF family protein [Antarctobacter heliothermus]